MGRYEHGRTRRGAAGALLALGLTPLALAPSLVSGPAGAAPGDPDRRSGQAGVVTTDLAGGDDVAKGMALQPDGKILVVGGHVGAGGSDFALARYRPDGRLDPTFGAGGVVTTDFGGADEAAAVVVDREGRAVVAGYGQAAGDHSDAANTDFALARYHPDGTLDPTFGNDGRVTTDLGRHEDANAVALQPDGKIVVAGCAKCLTNASNFAVARYHADGALDTGFGQAGHVTSDFDGQADEASAVVVLPDGKIVAAGFAAIFRPTGIGPGSRNANFGLARYRPDGAPDPGFGGDGKTDTDFADGNDSAGGLALQPDGKLVAAGLGFVDGGFKFVLSRYGGDGGLDLLFGRGGKVVTGFRDDRGGQVPGDGSVARGASANAVAVDVDGTVLAAGVDRDAPNENFALARYTPNGMLDASFGRGGLVTADFRESQDEANAVAITGDGRIVTAGVSGKGGFGDFGLAFFRGGLLADRPA